MYRSPEACLILLPRFIDATTTGASVLCALVGDENCTRIAPDSRAGMLLFTPRPVVLKHSARQPRRPRLREAHPVLENYQPLLLAMLHST